MTDRIARVFAWEALDSRGNPTVACRIETTDGAVGRAIVPSGASAGSHEAHELRDGAARYGGRGVRRAVEHVRGILGPLVVGMPVADHPAVDEVLRAADASPSFSTIGANATLAVSLAAALAAADSAGTSLARLLAGDGDLLLPMPMINIISGGAHAAGALDVQDFLVVPMGATSVEEAIEWSRAVREAATGIALDHGFDSADLVADEGGLGVRLGDSRAALDLLVTAIERAGLRPGVDAGIALDIAATEFFANGRYEMTGDGRSFTGAELVEALVGWCDDYPIISIEDPLDEDDWEQWTAITQRLGDRVQLIGDDLFVTQTPRLERGIREGAANAILVKVNQNGLVSGARHALDTAQQAGYATIVSARSGDTEDSWLTDLAIGWRAGQIKVGSTIRSERTSKWNRLLELEATEATALAQPLQRLTASNRTASNE